MEPKKSQDLLKHMFMEQMEFGKFWSLETESDQLVPQVLTSLAVALIGMSWFFQMNWFVSVLFTFPGLDIVNHITDGVFPWIMGRDKTIFICKHIKLLLLL